jgi:hypothetical protein
MAAKKPKTPPPPPLEDAYEDDRLTNSEIDIEEFLDEWGPGTAVVEIYRMKQDGSRPHVTRVSIDVLKADLYGFLREHCGAGKFCLQFKDAQRRIRKSIVVDVEMERGAVPGAPVNNDFQQQMILALIAAQKPAPPVDVGAILAGMGAMMTALKPTAPAADPSQMLQSITTTFATLKSAAGEEGGIQKALNLINAAKDLVPGGAEKTDDSWLGVAKDVTRTVVEVLRPKPNGNGFEHTPAALPAVPPGALPTARVYNADVAPGVADAAAGQPKNPEDILKEWIGAQLAFLKTKARAGKDPEFWVEYTLENAEEPGNAAILEAMRRGATFQHLLTFDPEIGKDPVLAGWFQRFYEELHAEFNADLDSGGPGGNAPDPGGNAKPSTD